MPHPQRRTGCGSISNLAGPNMIVIPVLFILRFHRIEFICVGDPSAAGGKERAVARGTWYSMFLVKWVPIFSKQTWILAKSSHFIESPFSLEHKIFRKKRSDRQFRCFCGEFCTLPVNHFHFAESPFYREKIAADFVQKFPFYRIPILSRMYCTFVSFKLAAGGKFWDFRFLFFVKYVFSAPNSKGKCLWRLDLPSPMGINV